MITLRIILFTLVVSALQAQVSPFPAAVVTNAQLKVALNNSQTQLAVSITSTQTSFQVSNCAPIVSNEIVTVDIEVMSVTSCIGTTMIVGARPFADIGNLAVTHNIGSVIGGFVDAWHHNSVVAELIAIETALGPNLSGITNGLTNLTLTGTMTAPIFSSGGTGWTEGNQSGTANIQALTGNQVGGFFIFPSGTAVASNMGVNNNSTIGSGSTFRLRITGGTASLQSIFNSGTPVTTQNFGEPSGGSSLTSINFQFAGSNLFTMSNGGVFTAAVLGSSAVPIGNVVIGNAATNVATITPTTMSAARAISLPDPGGSTNLMMGTGITCGSSATCASPTAYGANLKFAQGQVTFSSSTTQGVSGISPAFTSVNSYACMITNANGHAYTSGVEATSGSAFTATAGTSNSDTWTWFCWGI